MTLAQMLRSGTNIVWAERYLHEGRITPRTFDRFLFIANWAAARFSGVAGVRQEGFYQRFGSDAYWRRIERVRNLHDRIVSGAAFVWD